MSSAGIGESEFWQDKIIRELSWQDITILDSRRDDWDNSWKQEISTPQFREQVEWELAAIYWADVIAIYFDPESESPINLLKFGLCAGTGKLIVYCPEGFKEKGYIDIICRKYKIVNCISMSDFIFEIKKAIID